MTGIGCRRHSTENQYIRPEAFKACRAAMYSQPNAFAFMAGF